MYMTLYIALLFVLLSPGILVRLPPGGSKLTVAITHGIVFALLFYITHKTVWNYFYKSRFQNYDEDFAAQAAKKKTKFQNYDEDFAAQAAKKKTKFQNYDEDFAAQAAKKKTKFQNYDEDF